MPVAAILLEMSQLQQIINEEMAAKGYLSYARFSELALYCPNFGYYEKPDMEPGRKGDFFTSVSVGELFGQILAGAFATWLDELPGDGGCQIPGSATVSVAVSRVSRDTSPSELKIIEAGAHNGQLACDILGGLKTRRPDIFERLEYIILEPSQVRAVAQQKQLAHFGDNVRWLKSWQDFGEGGFRGICFGNELLDAMPVHQLAWDSKHRVWFEHGVERNGDSYGWIRMPAIECPRPLFDLPEELLAVLPDGFTTELCPAAEAWWKTAAQHLAAGRLVALDYGLRAEEFFMPHRKDGTARAYFKHRQSADLLANVGEQDLTANVNFSRIIAAGESVGLKTERFCSQAGFLTGTLQAMIGRHPEFANLTPAQVRQFQTLTHPEHLGEKFKALVQAR